MEVILVTDPQTWHEALLTLPRPHVLQSWPWGEFKGRHGWMPRRLLFIENGQTRAVAQVLRRRLPRLPLSVLYVPKGPVLDDYGDSWLLEEVLTTLEGLARQEKAVFVKIDPDVDWPPVPPEALADPPYPSDSLAGQVTATLHRRGWRFSGEQIQFRNTVYLDLTLAEEELLARMKSKTRYNIRLARRKGVVVRPGDEGDLSLFYRLYAETSARDGFIIRPYEYYRDAWSTFLRAGMAHLLLAWYENEPLAGLMLFRFGPTAWYMYGASSTRHRNRMPNHLLQWEAIRWAKAQGCTIYDMWGAPDVFHESDPMWGVYRFKAGFGGQVVRHIGAYDYPVSRSLYWLYTVLMPRLLALLRARHMVPAR